MAPQYRERLIDEVKRFPVLYDTRHDQHRDIDVRDRCWREIADKLGATSESLKREWKILRDSMRQALKRTGPGAARKRWRYHARMEFVLPYITRRERRSVADIKPDESEAGSEGERAPPPAWEPPAPAGAHDHLELFFASVCACTRRLPRKLQNRVKRLTLDALLRAEDELHDTKLPHDDAQQH